MPGTNPSPEIGQYVLPYNALIPEGSVPIKFVLHEDGSVSWRKLFEDIEDSQPKPPVCVCRTPGRSNTNCRVHGTNGSDPGGRGPFIEMDPRIRNL